MDNLIRFGDNNECEHLWSDLSITTRSFGWGEHQESADEIINEIRSGKFTAIVVSNLSSMSSDGVHIVKFVSMIGRSLQAFVHEGGHVAFPSSELGMIVESINSLFGSQWRQSSYYRTTVGASAENLHNVRNFFPNFYTEIYSAKSVYLRNVPENERCFGVLSSSRAESLSMILSGHVDVSRKDTGSIMEPFGESEYDVSIAVRKYGTNGGCVLVTGDVNFEYTTCQLISDFIHTRVNLGVAVRAFGADLEDAISPPIKQDTHCGYCKASGPPKKCSRCMQERYCNEDCQRGAWTAHKHFCGKSMESMRAQWKLMKPKTRVLLSSRTYTSPAMNEFLDEMRAKAESAFDAICDNDVASLEALLQQLDVNTTSDDAKLCGGMGLSSGKTLLAYVMDQEQRVDLIRLLLRHNADVNCVDADGKSVFTILYEIYCMQFRLNELKEAVALIKEAGYVLRPGESWDDFNRPPARTGFGFF